MNDESLIRAYYRTVIDPVGEIVGAGPALGGLPSLFYLRWYSQDGGLRLGGGLFYGSGYLFQGGLAMVYTGLRLGLNLLETDPEEKKSNRRDIQTSHIEIMEKVRTNFDDARRLTVSGVPRILLGGLLSIGVFGPLTLLNYVAAGGVNAFMAKEDNLHGTSTNKLRWFDIPWTLVASDPNWACLMAIPNALIIAEIVRDFPISRAFSTALLGMFR